MKIISFLHGDKPLRDPEGAYEFFKANSMGCHNIWVNISSPPTRGDSYEVYGSLTDFFAQIRFSFDTPQDAFSFASALPFRRKPDDVLGGEFYARFVADTPCNSPSLA